MRFMVMVKASDASEAGAMPSERLLAEMSRYNEELVKAGILLAGEGLHPSSKGVRVRFDGAERTVRRGPFPETRELVAGTSGPSSHPRSGPGKSGCAPGSRI